MARKKITDGLHQRKDGRWELKETINGKMRWFSSMDPAKVWEKRNEALMEDSDTSEYDKGPTFDKVADEYEGHVLYMKPGTQKSYLPAIRRARKVFGKMHMREIEPYMISQFLKMMGTSAHTTVSNQKTVINSIFQTWIDSPDWKGDNNPAELTKMPRGLKKGKREPPTDEQVKIVKEHYMDADALPAVVFLCTGERRGEACAIQLKDIDFDNNTISIYKSTDLRGDISGTKTDAGVRTIPLLKMLKEALQPLLSLSPNTYILSGSNKPLTQSQYTKKWSTFWRKYGYAHPKEHLYHYRNRKGEVKEYHHTDWTADVCAHQFRHEYVCMLCEAGVEESITIQIVGHANVQMIHEVYLSLKPTMLQNAAQKLNNLLAP